ncbi:unnamed protein product [Didymodactylos carnosus]|uniref:Uncharacterized protein n=1 Tax=Didymodactylos carnosus TaxID=1234261 RepID=A0A814KJH8_9BILA|nr:unnamed protein product [Didymodactylos carnosus]CAF3821611.1 unnamed protein product [Didymodactylos carnosus]
MAEKHLRYYSPKVYRQQRRRTEKNKVLPQDSSSSSDDNIDANEPTAKTTELNVTNYAPDDDDNTLLDTVKDPYRDSSPPLYKDSSTSIMTTIRLITEFCMNVNMDKSNMIKLMKIVKSLLPTTQKKILGAFGKACLSTAKYLCANCHQLTSKTRYGSRKCENNECLSSSRTLTKKEIIEVITLDIRSQIQSIIQ